MGDASEERIGRLEISIGDIGKTLAAQPTREDFDKLTLAVYAFRESVAAKEARQNGSIERACADATRACAKAEAADDKAERAIRSASAVKTWTLGLILRVVTLGGLSGGSVAAAIMKWLGQGGGQ